MGHDGRAEFQSETMAPLAVAREKSYQTTRTYTHTHNGNSVSLVQRTVLNFCTPSSPDGVLSNSFQTS